MTLPVRVRFAPSPTGPLHIGGVRTALYNHLLAKKLGGTMILRIEDTDQTRFVPGAEAYIQEALAWVGIELQESPWVGGPYAPYRQSERKAMYKQYADQLLAEGYAYYAFDTEEELDEMRERLKAAKVPDPKYNSITRATMKNSLTLPEDEVKAKLAAGDPYVIRLKVPRKEEIRLNDLIRGWVMVHAATLDDKVLMKSDGMPTYHLANVVDDYLMKITHVIRGEEWLPSAPTHVLLYKYLGWEASMPQFAHLPLLLKPDGNGKLSKRDGDLGGYPVFPLVWNDPATGSTFKGFREEGYLPDAMMNFLALLGWNPGNHEELFDEQALIEAFTVERIGKSGTKFDIQKAKWFNQQYLRKKPDAELVGVLLSHLTERKIACTDEKALQIIQLVKERITFPQDVWLDIDYFFETPQSYDAQVAQSKWNAEVVQTIEVWLSLLKSDQETWTAEHAKHILHLAIEQAGVKMGKVMQALRLALTGLGQGPDLAQIMLIVGKEEVILRLTNAIQKIEVPV